MVLMPSLADPPGTIKWRIIKDFSLVTNESEENVVEGEVINGSYQITYNNLNTNLPLCAAPAAPALSVPPDVTIVHTPETDATSEFEAETDTLINSCYHSDTRFFDAGLVRGIHPILGLYYSESALDPNTGDQVPCVFTCTEDSEGSIKVDYYTQYWIRRYNCANYRLKQYSSTDPDYSGFMPYIQGYLNLGAGEVGLPTKKKINVDTDWGFSASNGDGDGTWDNATPPPVVEKHYLRNAADKRTRGITGENSTVVTHIAFTGFQTGGVFYLIPLALRIKCYHVDQLTSPPNADTGLPLPSYIFYKDVSTSQITCNWTGYERAYIWVKGVSTFADNELYLRVNPTTSPIDAPIIAPVSSTADWKLLEIDISGLGITSVSHYSLVYDDGSGPIGSTPAVPPGPNPLYTIKEISVDSGVLLAKKCFAAPTYQAAELYTPGAFADAYLKAIRRNIEFGTSGVVEEEVTPTFSLETGVSLTTLDSYRIYAGFANGLTLAPGSTYASNGQGILRTYAGSFANRNVAYGVMRITGLEGGSPSISGILRSVQSASGLISTGTSTDEQGLASYVALNYTTGSIKVLPYRSIYTFFTSQESIGAYDIYESDTDQDFWVSPWNGANEEAQPPGEFFGQMTDKIYDPDPDDEVFDGFVRAIDSYLWYQVKLNEEDPENIVAEVQQFSYDPETEVLSAGILATGPPYDEDLILDWTVRP